MLCVFGDQEKLNASSKTPQTSSQKGENRVAKRKLYSPSAATHSDDEGAYILLLVAS